MAFNSTTGLGVAAVVNPGVSQNQTLSLSSAGGHTATLQLEPEVTDVSGAVQTGVALTLSAAANASAGTTAYTGTITGGGSNAFKGFSFTVAGFTNAANNGGPWECTASNTTTLTLTNAAGVAETHAGTATSDEATYPFVFVSRNPNQATVSASGLITSVAEGGAVVEVSYPAFGNSVGTANDGSYANKIYSELNVSVVI